MLDKNLARSLYDMSEDPTEQVIYQALVQTLDETILDFFMELTAFMRGMADVECEEVKETCDAGKIR